MPRKKQKKRKINTKLQDPKDIPYSKYRVEWIDCVSDSGWATDKEFDKMQLATPVNEGWMYEKNKKFVKLFASYDKDTDGSISFGDRTMIPTPWITKITKIN
jgi:Ca2+-binding EF-hand superfamily protein|tara:strand:- start:390 stop:695 length:306 start_codon:yes stop_codon:yes gene_type:complete